MQIEVAGLQLETLPLSIDVLENAADALESFNQLQAQFAVSPIKTGIRASGTACEVIWWLLPDTGFRRPPPQPGQFATPGVPQITQPAETPDEALYGPTRGGFTLREFKRRVKLEDMADLSAAVVKITQEAGLRAKPGEQAAPAGASPSSDNSDNSDPTLPQAGSAAETSAG